MNLFLCGKLMEIEGNVWKTNPYITTILHVYMKQSETERSTNCIENCINNCINPAVLFYVRMYDLYKMYEVLYAINKADSNMVLYIEKRYQHEHIFK